MDPGISRRSEAQPAPPARDRASGVSPGDYLCDMTTRTVLHGHWRTVADNDQQVHVVLAEAMRMSLCLRDEEARQGVQADALERLDRTDDFSSLGLVLTLGQETSIPEFL
jgi:hypothetical protein